MLTRNLFTKIFAHLFDENRHEYICIVGPRQAGKTTLLGMIEHELLKKDTEAKNVIKLTFEDPFILDSFREDPKLFLKNIIRQTSKKVFLLLDEYQYDKEGGSHLKLLYDDPSFKNVKIIITGSSSLDLNDVVSKMVGRMFGYELTQLTFAEIIDNIEQVTSDESIEMTLIQQCYHDFSLIIEDFLNIHGENSDWEIISQYDRIASKLNALFSKYAIWGGYPAVLLADSDQTKMEILLNIYNAYVEKDIIRQLKLGNAESFANYVRYLAICIGQLINFSSIQSELNLTYREARNFLKVLEDTFVVKKIRPYYSNKINEIKKNPIIYFTDTGLRNWAVRDYKALDQRTDLGHLVENAIYLGLKRISSKYDSTITDINYWRKLSGTEVDFVIQKNGGQELIPIEVKYTHFKGPQITKSFRSFIDEFEPNKGIVITKDYFNTIDLKSKGNKRCDVLFVPASLI